MKLSILLIYFSESVMVGSQPATKIPCKYLPDISGNTQFLQQKLARPAHLCTIGTSNIHCTVCTLYNTASPSVTIVNCTLNNINRLCF